MAEQLHDEVAIGRGIALGVALGYLYDSGYFTSKKNSPKADADPASQRLDEEDDAPR